MEPSVWERPSLFQGSTAEIGTTEVKIAMRRFARSLLAWIGLHGKVSCVPRESPLFDPELHVPDMSTSEAVPQADRRESEKGCHWTSRLKFELCGEDNCHESEILAFDFQRKSWDFYEGRSTAPPLEEAAFIMSMPLEEMHGAFELCPGMVITGLLLAAEAMLFSMPPSDRNPLQEAKGYLQFLFSSSREEYDTLISMWPVLQGQRRAEDANSRVSTGHQPSVDVVIARCGTTLRWLWSLPLPSQARVFIYSKCDVKAEDLQKQLEGIVGRVAQVVEVPLTDPAGWMTGECTAYLRHLLSGLARSGPVHSLADYTIFLHDDAPRHLKQEFLSIVFRSLSLGTYNVSFLNLAHERYVSAVTPCLKQLYAMVMGRQLAGRLSTYCCGHFVVKSSRLHEIPLEPLRRLYAAVQAGTYTAQAGGPCEAISADNGTSWV
eukprot:s4970_g3.t4